MPLPPDTAFDMVANADTRVLVLGSLPGRQSLAQGRYYANPRNQFWQLLSPVVGADLVAMAYPQRLATLLVSGIGLWDVIASARRQGSLDTAIRDAALRDLPAAAAALPQLRALAFNGQKAFAIGQRQMKGHPSPALVALPSSSSAHTASLAIKQAAWSRLRDHLG
ncbi:MAG TPA: DNA-deoxyinosine glycosylase [Novosphingobium sp.]|nr:DNA-deoxyinosine glycosylase [Novosphingobium sp.]